MTGGTLGSCVGHGTILGNVDPSQSLKDVRNLWSLSAKDQKNPINVLTKSTPANFQFQISRDSRSPFETSSMLKAQMSTLCSGDLFLFQGPSQKPGLPHSYFPSLPLGFSLQVVFGFVFLFCFVFARRLELM